MASRRERAEASGTAGNSQTHGEGKADTYRQPRTRDGVSVFSLASLGCGQLWR